MNLTETLSLLNGDDMIFIGSKSAFIFIGKKNQFEKHIDSCMEGLYYADNDFLPEMKRKVKELNEKYQQMPDKLGSGKYASGSVRKEIMYLNHKITKEQEKIFLHNMPIRKREVKDVYERLLGDGTVIIVEGFELGRFWLPQDAPWNKDAIRKAKIEKITWD